MELVDQSDGTRLPPTFGASLRAARLSRNITLDAVAAHTKINRAFFQDLERNDLSKWPSNRFYRESYLRAYAEAIGLDPHEVIDGFRRELAGGETSNAADSSSRPRRLTPVTIPVILAATFVSFYLVARSFAPGTDIPQTPSAAVEAPAAIEPTKAPTPEPSSKELTAAEPAAPDSNAVAPVDPGPIEGELVITSTPPGARVLVNGIGRGSTPVRVRYLPAGSYAIRFILAGHQSVTLRATLSARRPQAQVSASLTPIETSQAINGQ